MAKPSDSIASIFEQGLKTTEQIKSALQILFSFWIQLLPVKLWVCYGLKIPRTKDVGSQNVLQA